MSSDFSANNDIMSIKKKCFDNYGRGKGEKIVQFDWKDNFIWGYEVEIMPNISPLLVLKKLSK